MKYLIVICISIIGTRAGVVSALSTTILSDDDKTLVHIIAQRTISRAQQGSGTIPVATQLTTDIERFTTLLRHRIVIRNARLKRIIEFLISELSITRQQYLTGPISVGTITGSLSTQILQLINLQRTQRGLTGLILEDRLSLAAQRHAEYMASSQDFAHETRAGSTPSDRASAVGYEGSSIAENIGRCSTIGSSCDTPEEMMRQWMDSPGHRANILDPSLIEVGVGYHSGYRVQLFGSR